MLYVGTPLSHAAAVLGWQKHPQCRSPPYTLGLNLGVLVRLYITSLDRQESRGNGIGIELRGVKEGADNHTRANPTSHIHDGNLVRANFTSTNHPFGLPAPGLSCKEGTSTHSPGHGSRTRR